MGEQGAFRLAGRAARVDQEETVVRFRRARGARWAGRLEGRPDARKCQCRLGQRAQLVLDEQHRGLCVVELEGDLGRGEPPGDRVEDRARLRTREEHRHVVGRVAGQRRDAAPRLEAGCELVRAAFELGVRPGAAGRVDRDAPRCRTGTVAEDPVDRHGGHPRNLSTIPANSSVRSQKSMCPAPSIRSSRAPAIRSARRSEFRGSTTVSPVPVTTSVGASILSRRSPASHAAPAPACAAQPPGSGGCFCR